MAHTSDSEMAGKDHGDSDRPSFLPMIIGKIRARREELGDGEWLSEELRVALDEMAPILQRAHVTFEHVGGRKRSIVIRAMGPGDGGPNCDVEAYSIKMMANCLKNAGSLFLSRALAFECREARQQLIDKLTEMYRLLADPQAPPGGASERGTNGEVSPFEVALRERQRKEGRARLLSSILAMTTATRFREEDEVAFQRIFDTIWQEVDAGELGEAVAVGKILDRIYAERSQRLAPARAVEPAPASPQTPEPSELPPILDNWVGQGLTAHRIFRDLQKTPDIKTLASGWTKISTARRIDVEYLFILHVLNSVARFEADGATLACAFPRIPKMGFADFEKLVEEGKANGAGEVDPRIWGVVGAVYSFLKNWLGPLLEQR